MTNQKSLSISHVNVGYATGGKFSLISLLMEVTLTIFQQLCQPAVCVRVRERCIYSTVCGAQMITYGITWYEVVFFPSSPLKRWIWGNIVLAQI